MATKKKAATKAADAPAADKAVKEPAAKKAGKPIVSGEFSVISVNAEGNTLQVVGTKSCGERVNVSIEQDGPISVSIGG